MERFNENGYKQDVHDLDSQGYTALMHCCV